LSLYKILSLSLMKQLLFFIALFPFSFLAQHTISGTFAPAENYSWAILYKITPTATVYTTDVQLDENGGFVMELDQKVVPGIYRMIYGMPQEKNMFDIVYSGKEDITVAFNEGKGVTFSTSEENKLWSNYKKQTNAINKDIASLSDVEPLLKKQQKLQESYQTLTKGMFIENFILANQPYFPTTFTTKEKFLLEKKQHYFNPINVNNKALQESDFILKKIYSYLTQKEDAEKVSHFLMPADLKYQKSTLQNIWKKLIDNKKVDIANHLGVTYLVPIAKKLGDDQLADIVLKFSKISIGAKAPDFSWKEHGKSTWLSQLNSAKNYILVFWSSSCSHCLKQLPKLHTEIEKINNKDYQVLAVGLENDIENWKNVSEKMPLFTHIPGLGKWENSIAKLYDINKTPTYFILNSEKTITKKPNTLKDLVAIFH